MSKLFDLVSDERLTSCILVWERSIEYSGRPALAVPSLFSLKDFLVHHPDYEVMYFEAFQFQDADFSQNETLIDVIFTLMDSYQLH
ncbi:hypothetical protein IDSA_11500 [Pseudidiomarina salinarum]|uniref:Uncharacterized protein n=1 Tax=Pseudidiomarina salinarum TaxID=435908 RepID=A0A094IR69_9GAMM|nr:hypothetical protein IDSA_11500 [Pseudidiomarina salinarum]RUO68682.1 hypothetical protein CWI79_11485 [Pseudidiomarina salinarum]